MAMTFKHNGAGRKVFHLEPSREGYRTKYLRLTRNNIAGTDIFFSVHDGSEMLSEASVVLTKAETMDLVDGLLAALCEGMDLHD